MLDPFTDEGPCIDAEAESSCDHTTVGSISQATESIAAAETLRRGPCVITPHWEFLWPLNEIIQILVLLML